MSFNYGQGFWWVVFWNNDRMRTPLPRKARFRTDEAIVAFVRRAGAARTLEDKNSLELMIQRKSGEISLELTDEPYAKLCDR